MNGVRSSTSLIKNRLYLAQLGLFYLDKEINEWGSKTPHTLLVRYSKLVQLQLFTTLTVTPFAHFFRIVAILFLGYITNLVPKLSSLCFIVL